MTPPDTPPADVASEKAALRRAALAARSGLPADHRRAAAEAIARHGAALAAERAPQRVSLFWPVRGEIDTGPLAARLTEMGVKLCLPVIVAKAQPLLFRDWGPGDALEQKSFGLMEPPDGAAEATPDLLFVPLAAFDRAGGRVGYGGGFYDRTLERLRAARGALAVGLAFAAQEVARAPVEPHDQPLDMLLTEDGFVYVRAPR